jgi:hypothetical protein
VCQPIGQVYIVYRPSCNLLARSSLHFAFTDIAHPDRGKRHFFMRAHFSTQIEADVTPARSNTCYTDCKISPARAALPPPCGPSGRQCWCCINLPAGMFPEFCWVNRILFQPHVELLQKIDILRMALGNHEVEQRLDDDGIHMLF